MKNTMRHESKDWKEGYGLGLRRAQGILFAEAGKVLVESDRMDIPARDLHEAIFAANRRMDSEAKRMFKVSDKSPTPAPEGGAS